jgi:putative tryptophan/tyrosine transport system substrate-binding protein
MLGPGEGPMKRREFISLLCGTVTAWPVAVGAQQDRMRRIVALRDTEPSDPDAQSDFVAFETAFQALGWTLGRTVTVDYRWSGGDPERSRALAKELVKMAPDLIISVGTAAVSAFKNETRTIPIVFARVSDPVGKGLVASLARPGGNITGFSNFELDIGGKWLEILKEIAPSITHVAVIANPGTTTLDGFFDSIATASRALGVESLKVPVHDLSEVTSAMVEVAGRPGGAVIVPADGFMISNRHAVIAQAIELRLPVVYSFRFFVTDGGLVSYGINTIEQFRGLASYVDRILKGKRPSDLPVQAPTKFELAINLIAAKAIGLTVPSTMLVRADEVIE